MTSPAFVALGERRLSLMTAGQGTPLVILEAGAGDASTTWQGIFPAVAHFTQVLAYDRAGLGQSDVAPRPRTAWQLTDDLEQLLRLAQLTGPCVLVGHSLGALLSRLYAQRYPQEVAGLVLIDGPHPEQGSRFTGALTASGYHQHELVQPILEMAAGVPPEAHPEGLDFARSLAQIDPTHRFDALRSSHWLRENPMPTRCPIFRKRQQRPSIGPGMTCSVISPSFPPEEDISPQSAADITFIGRNQSWSCKRFSRSSRTSKTSHVRDELSTIPFCKEESSS